MVKEGFFPYVPNVSEITRIYYTLLRCPKLTKYQMEIIETISSVFGSTVPLDALMCLLGALDTEVHQSAMFIAKKRLLYVTRKMIVLNHQ